LPTRVKKFKEADQYNTIYSTEIDKTTRGTYPSLFFFVPRLMIEGKWFCFTIDTYDCPRIARVRLRSK
jgi:hypothetical protein